MSFIEFLKNEGNIEIKIADTGKVKRFTKDINPPIKVHINMAKR